MSHRVAQELTLVTINLSFINIKNGEKEMMRFLAISVLFIALGCSSTTEKRPSNMASTSLPEWIYSPEKQCNLASELCASAEGSSFSHSDLNARKALASVFATNVRYQLEINKLTTSSANKTEITEEVSSNLSQQVDEVLQSSSVKERFEKDGAFYSMAIIDRRKAQKILELKIKQLDDQLIHNYRLKNRLYLNKMLIAYHTRSELNEKLIILSNKSIESPLTLSQIQLLKFMSTGKEKVFVSRETELPKSLVSSFKSMLTNLNYQLVPKNASDFNIGFSYSAKDAYLNIEGFKKMIFHVSVEVMSPKKGRVGGYSFNVEAQGRTTEDCINKMKKSVELQFEKNLEKLNLK